MRKKPPSPFKFKKGNKLSFPKQFFEKYDGDLSDVPQKRSRIITSTRDMGLKYYVRFIDADYCPFGQNEIKKGFEGGFLREELCAFFFSPPTPTEKKFWLA